MSKHNLKKIFIQISIRFLIFAYINNINKILSTGKLPNKPDTLMCTASNFYKKHSKKPKSK